MNNEIGRKITSLTLLSILLASGVTFAVPGAISSAEASHNANLFVSAENSAFSNYFAGPQVIEVVVNDPNINKLDDALGEPDVTVNGKKLRMAQATDGNWYGYFADRVQAMTADNTQDTDSTTADGDGLNFGGFCDNDDGASLRATGSLAVSDTVGFAIPRDETVTGEVDSTAPTALSTTCSGDPIGSDNLAMHVIRENKTLNKAYPGNIALEGGQIGVLQNAWPFIQLYDFSAGGNVVIKYNKGGGAQTTTLTFDTIPSNLVNTSLDRATYPQGAQVHVTLTDPQLNIDPTDEDSWTWGTNSTNSTLYYQLFDENGIADSSAINAENLIGNLTSLMFEKNGKLTVNLAASGSTVAVFGDNDDQVFPATVMPKTIHQQMSFVESGANVGIFGNYDESDNANLDITSTAPRGQSATIRYNDVSKSVVVGFGFGTLGITIEDGEWNSGEEVPVTLVDSDANKNSRSDEDLDNNQNSTSLIPSLRVGSPFT
ncbi:MAG: hypothetical protein ACREAE_02105, partial [Nitrosopumilaceae archaeon]